MCRRAKPIPIRGPILSIAAEPRLPFGYAYRQAGLYCEDVALAEIAAEIGTPAYIYSSASIAAQHRAFAAATAPFGARICYALKANSNQAVIRTLAALGTGADVVSEGEIRRALKAGIPAASIVFSGVAKTEQELRFGLDAGIGQINVENEAEFEQLGRLAAQRAGTVRIAFRINPDIDARTHPKIATGQAGSKFGIPYSRAASLYHQAAAMPGIEATAVAVHIGSQLLDLEPFAAAFTRIAELVRALRGTGHAIRHLDLGGGLGVDYQGRQIADLDRYVEILRATIGPLGCSLTFEPGRYLVAASGVLITRVLAVKQHSTGTSILQDGAMNDLIRPTLYGAEHPIWPMKQAVDPAKVTADIVGPVCESGDYLALGCTLPLPEQGDLLAVGYAGAYGAAMSSTYNSRLLVPEVMVKGDAWHLVRQRQTYDELIGQDILPPWLTQR